MKSLIIKFLLSLILCIFLVTFCYFFVDREVAWAVHNQHFLTNFPALNYVSMIKPLLFTLSTLGFIYYIIKYLSSSIKKIDTVWLQASLAVAIATLIDITVKLYIHRYWFNTWVNNNPSLDVNHAYGFNFFYDASHEIASFPSGHTALTTSFLIVFWIAYPKSRILCALLILAVGLGLILADFHYVGDVIAGGFMGAYIGIFSSLLSKKLRLL